MKNKKSLEKVYSTNTNTINIIHLDKREKNSSMSDHKRASAIGLLRVGNTKQIETIAQGADI